jgi:hypothetical protein
MLVRFSCSLRRDIIVVSLLALPILLVAGCAGSQERDAEPAVSSFVGKAEPSQKAFVAIVVPGGEPDSGERKVKAYLCDGWNIWEWFEGSMPENELDFTSDNGAKLKATYTQKAINGTIDLSDGTSFTFETSPTTGASGLYTVNIGSDGRFEGFSEAGGLIRGTIDEEPSGGKHTTTGTVTSPDGDRFDIEAASVYRGTGEARLIISGNQLVGADLGRGPDAFRIEGLLE